MLYYCTFEVPFCQAPKTYLFVHGDAMNLRSLVPCVALAALGFVLPLQSYADTTPLTGTFSADNSVFTDTFTTTSTQVYDIFTTSYATGGFVPVLTLFGSSGNVIDNSGPGTSDASLMDTLPAGSYTLDLTEFPNVANGSLSDGFLLAGSPNATGDNCCVSGGTFLDPFTCSQRTNNYALTVSSSAAVTPEPSTWLLLLTGSAALLYTERRRRMA